MKKIEKIIIILLIGIFGVIIRPFFNGALSKNKMFAEAEEYFDNDAVYPMYTNQRFYSITDDSVQILECNSLNGPEVTNVKFILDITPEERPAIEKFLKYNSSKK